MIQSSSRFLSSLLIPGSCILLFTVFNAHPASAQDDESRSQPQIVRLSYVQGDVRIAPGRDKHPDLSGGWEQAVTNTPILQDYSLATGDGRAEIEFENGSTAYLAENSVLLFEKLSSKNYVPTTQVRLITGTATFSVDPAPKEKFTVETTTDELTFPKKSFLRVDSYMDATSVTPQNDKGDDVLRGALKTIHLDKGKTISTDQGEIIQLGGPQPSTGPADWDTWVSQRVQTREMDTAAALKASGLTSFVPGITDLYRTGTFFDCSPYGKCWEPNGLSRSVQSIPVSQQSNPAGLQQTQTSAQQVQIAPPRKRTYLNPRVSYEPLGDCFGSSLRTETVIDPLTGKETVVQETVESSPWDWGLCNSGYWIYPYPQNARCTFVVGRKHHHPPVIPVKCGTGNCWVPRHPLDQKGKTPINLKYGIWMHKPGMPVQRVPFNPGQKYTVLNKQPAGLNGDKSPHLPPVGRPVITAQLRSELMPSVKPVISVGGVTLTARNTPAPVIKYDYSSHNFVRTVNPGSGTKPGTTTLVGSMNHGNHGGPVVGSPKTEVVGSVSTHGTVRSGYSGVSGSGGGYSGGHSSAGNSGGGSRGSGSSSGGGSSGGHSAGSSGGGSVGGGGHSGGGGGGGGVGGGGGGGGVGGGGGGGGGRGH
ncbi:MAG TPA: FecR family protein [Candidatus Acidoferrales bacterium]|nr:FecR family protein [Candidatus Acidoferrales bacterium]